jgi:hypothetical protein
MNDYELQFVRHTVLNFFQDLKIKVSVFLKEKVQNWACNPNFNPDRASEYYEDLIDINQNSVLEKKNSFVSAQTN